MKKKITIITTLALGACALAFSAVSLSKVEANAAVEKPIEYSYALLGDSYEVKKGIVSATHPNGSAISTEGNSVYLDWAQGSYQFEYATKIVDVKVYEYAPEDTLNLLGSVPSTAVVGVESTFPAMTAETTIDRTDGAPDIAPYNVSAVFWCNGKRVHMERNVTESFTYAPVEAGFWMLSYEYMNIFGQTVSKDYMFQVADERMIVTPWAESYCVGDTISLTDAYGFYQGEKSPVTVSVKEPSGVTLEASGAYTFTSKGKHTFTLTSSVAGETVTRVLEIDVVAGLASFVGDTAGFGAPTMIDTPDAIRGDSVSNEGVLYDMTANSASFGYKGVIDLNKLGKHTPVVAFTTNNTYAGNISKVKVTLTDVYDSTKSMNVVFARNSDMTATSIGYDNTFITANFGSVTTAVNNYRPLKNTAVSWDSTFHTYWWSKAHQDENKTYQPRKSQTTMNFAFDVENAIVYTYGQCNLAEWGDYTPPAGYPTGTGERWYPIANLTDASLASQFEGFTTGEVYLTLSVEAGRGDILLHSIGGKKISVDDVEYNENTAITLGEFDGSLKAAKGYAYSLPVCSNQYISKVERSVSYNGTPVAIENDAFVPTQTGIYTVTYTAVNAFGRTVSKEIQVECIEKEDISISYVEDDTLSMGNVYTIKEPSISGGYGEISYTVTLNGNPVSVGEKVLVDSEMKLVVTAKDWASESSEEFILSVNKDVVEFKVSFPKVAPCGKTFTFPTATIYDYQAEKELAYEIYVNGEKQGESMVLPTAPTTLEVEYRTTRGSQTYTLHVKNEKVESSQDAVLLGEGASVVTSEEGTKFTVSASDPVVEMPYMISPNALRFEFFVLKEELNFDEMYFRMTDKNGVSVKVAIGGLLSESPTLFINGENTMVAIKKTSQNFLPSASEGYANKAYYTFSLEYENWNKAMLSAGKIQAAIATDERGLTFNGFDGGVYFEFAPNAINGTEAKFVVVRLSNQLFYDSSFDYGDITGPVLCSPDFALSNIPVLSGYTLDVSRLTSYDVLQGDSTVKVTLTMADGTVKYDKVDPATAEKVTFTTAGSYQLRVTTADKAGQRNNSTYLFTVEDDTAPVITVSGEMPQTAKKGDTVKLAKANVTDESAVNSKIIVFCPNGDMTTVATGNSAVVGELKDVAVGRYVVYYVAEDVDGNVTMSQGYIITVEE